MIEDLEKFGVLEIKISRRNFLGMPLLPGIIANLQVSPWTSEQWWPLKPGKRSDRGTALNVLHEVGGPLHIHDVEHGSSHAREWAEDFANYVLNLRPDAADWAGYCSWLAVAGMAKPRPGGSVRFKQITKEGLLVAKYGGTTLEPVRLNDAETTLSEENWVYVELAEKTGEWYRVAYGIRDGRTGKEIFVTNYSFGDKWMPLSRVRFAAKPVFNRSLIPDNEETLRWKYLHTAWENPELDHNLIDWIISQ